MKVLFQHNVINCGPWFLRMGYARVLQSIGHEIYHWFSEKKSANDMFDEIGCCDLFFGQTYTLNRTLINRLKECNTKVILQCSTWGPITDNLDLKKYPILVPNEQEKIYVRQLHETIGNNLGFVFLNYHENRLEETLSYWKSKLDVDILGSPCAADTFAYSGGEFKPEYESDISYIGGNWGYKGQNLNKFIIPLCNENSAPRINGKKIKVKIWGNGWQGLPQYLGPIQEEEVKYVFASAKICLNISEPHSQALGFDCVERIWKTGLAKTIVLSDYVESLDKDIFGNLIEYYKNYQELYEKITFILKNMDSFEELIQKRRLFIMTEQTYFNRVYDMFQKLNLMVEAEKIKNKHEEEYKIWCSKL